jgi:transketolase
VLWDPPQSPQAILIATGSEVSIALDAARQLARDGIGARVVSMPSWDFFEAQPQEYRDSVLPPDIHNRVSVEAGTTLGWERFIGLNGRAVGIDEFGRSAPGAELYRRFGLTPERVAQVTTSLVKGVRQ